MWILGLKDKRDYLINLCNALSVYCDEQVDCNGADIHLIVIECASDDFKICFKREKDRDMAFKNIITAVWCPWDEDVIDLRKEMHEVEY